MRIEICDLCRRPVSEFDYTEVTIKDYKGVTADQGGFFPAKRKFKGVICDDCLKLLRERTAEQKEEKKI